MIVRKLLMKSRRLIRELWKTVAIARLVRLQVQRNFDKALYKYRIISSSSAEATYFCNSLAPKSKRGTANAIQSQRKRSRAPANLRYANLEDLENLIEENVKIRCEEMSTRGKCSWERLHMWKLNVRNTRYTKILIYKKCVGKYNARSIWKIKKCMKLENI